MIAMQEDERKSTTARERCRSQIPGWLLIFSLALVGINVGEQHLACKNFDDIVHEIVPAQPQEKPAYHGRKTRQGGGEHPNFVRAPTSDAKYARASPWQPTLPLQKQGEQPRQAQARRRRARPRSEQKKVRDWAKNERRISEFWENIEELITPGNFPSNYFVPTPKNDNNNRTPELTPINAAANVDSAFLTPEGEQNQPRKDQPNMPDSTESESDMATKLEDSNVGSKNRDTSSDEDEEQHRDATENSQHPNKTTPAESDTGAVEGRQPAGDSSTEEDETSD